MKKEEKAVAKFIELFSKVTFRICHWDSDGVIQSRSSGFLYQKNQDSPLLVITAGHYTPQDGSFIETNYVKDNCVAAINTGKFTVFYNGNDIDYAYSILPIELITKSLTPDMSFDFVVYKEPFIKAENDEVYGFAVRNNYEFARMGDAIVAPTYLCSELYLELVKQDEHVNFFKPAGQIKEHEYYKGASGSPIADPSGKITSILIGGTDPIELLKGFRLDNVDLP